MILLDAFFRFTGFGLLAVIAIVALRDGRSWRSRPYLLLACVSLGALYLGYAVEPLRPTGTFLIVLRLLDVPHLVFVWLFALSLFQRSFRLQPAYIIVGVAYCLPIYWLRLSGFEGVPTPPNWLYPLISVGSILLVGHLLFRVLGERADDLNEARRRSRIYFVFAIILSTVATVATDLIPQFFFGLHPVTIKIVSIWPAIAAGAYWIVSLNKTAVNFDAPIVTGDELSASDARLWAKLKFEMTENEAYKRDKLDITALAKELGVSQHTLRRLINQVLHFKNFSHFINSYRVDEAKRILSTRENDSLPVLTIAYSSGFQSLSSFNRAFKEIEGTTPSKFRQSERSGSEPVRQGLGNDDRVGKQT